MIRDATERDIQKCSEILTDSLMWEKYERTLLDALIFIGYEVRAGNYLWVYEEDGTVIGFIGGVERAMMGEFPYVRVLAVEREHRGKGVGTRLLRYLEEEMFARSHLIFMMVSDFNVDALRLYLRLGYEKVGVIPHYKKEGINENLLVKRRS